MLTLQTPIEKIFGVGPKMVKRLQNLGLEKVEDLLFYYPRRWMDFSKTISINQIISGQEATIKAKILQIKTRRSPKKRMFLTSAIVEDNKDQLEIIWFNQPFLVKTLKAGTTWIFQGKVEYDFTKKTKVMVGPVFERQVGIFPIYSETVGLTSKYLRRILLPLLNITSQIIEFLPESIKKSENLVDLPKAIKEIHFPKNWQNLQNAKQRLAFDELFLITLRMLLAKKDLQKETAPKIPIQTELCRKLVKSLPFKLTNAQRKAAWEILKDLSRPAPMNRLLEGEVGSGKTVVGALAVLSTVKSGLQAVWMAPTEILANQHYKNLTKLLAPFKLKIALLTSATSKKKDEALKSDFIIGTHALIQEKVQFPNLGLVIVDEQHRFGVKQRARLRSQKTLIPHFLSMTATPIPRTLALALYGDLDISILDELPPGRQKIQTRVIDPSGRQKAYDFIRKEIKKGRQAFVVCPLIEEKEKVKTDLFEEDRKAAIAEYKKLSESIFPNLKIGLLHGKMKSKEKEEVMAKFAKGHIDILVSTAVVEVGIDVPNATVMMIEDAERFGLADLHQFRGRIGRSKFQSYCFLFAHAWTRNAKARLKAVRECNNGFELAEKDLQIRGPGELSGIRQWGLPDLKMASLSDIILINKARRAAEKVVSQIENYPILKEKISKFQIERHLE